MTARRAVSAAAAGVLLAGLAGCAGDGEPADGGATASEVASPLADCAALAAPPPAAEAGDATGSDPSGGTEPAPTDVPDLPGLTLSCFTGGEPFRLTDLRGPAVVNLWASWCHPCRQELPVFQRYADQADGRVHVVGVLVRDHQESAASFATDLGITFPSLADPETQVPPQVGVVGLPATLYVDATGKVVYRHLAGALDAETLAAQAREHLGVVVP